MSKADFGVLLLAIAIAGAGCSSEDGGGAGGTGGTGGPNEAFSFDAETSLPATGGAAAVMVFAAQFGGALSGIVQALGGVPVAGSLVSVPKIDIDIPGFCTVGGTATLDTPVIDISLIQVGHVVTLTLTDCAGSPIALDPVSGTVELTITEINVGFDADAVVDLTIGATRITGSFDVFAEVNITMSAIRVNIGRERDDDLITVTDPEIGQLQLGCFGILQRINFFDDDFLSPLGVVNLNGKIYTINDYTQTVPAIFFDGQGVPRSGEMMLRSGDLRVTSEGEAPCTAIGTAMGDGSFVDAVFNEGGCIDLSGVGADGGPFEASTNWDKLLDRDFTAGGGEACAPSTGTTPASPPNVSCPGDGDLVAIADTFITGDGPEPDRMLANTNFGTSTSLLIKSVPNLGFTRKIYIVFDVNDAPSFTKASLVLTLDRHVVNPDPAKSGPQPVNVFGITDGNDWDPADLPESGQDGITWNNAPRNVTTSSTQFEQSPGVPLYIAGYDFDLPPVGEIDPPTDRETNPSDPVVTRYALDVTQYLMDTENDADGKITILMAVSNPDNLNVDGSVFFSREVSEECDRPFLHFE